MEQIEIEILDGWISFFDSKKNLRLVEPFVVNVKNKILKFGQDALEDEIFSDKEFIDLNSEEDDKSLNKFQIEFFKFNLNNLNSIKLSKLNLVLLLSENFSVERKDRILYALSRVGFHSITVENNIEHSLSKLGLYPLNSSQLLINFGLDNIDLIKIKDNKIIPTLRFDKGLRSIDNLIKSSIYKKLKVDFGVNQIRKLREKELDFQKKPNNSDEKSMVYESSRTIIDEFLNQVKNYIKNLDSSDRLSLEQNGILLKSFFEIKNIDSYIARNIGYSILKI